MSIHLFKCIIKYIQGVVIMYIKRIKELRLDNDKVQKEIAFILKITQQQYSLYEKGLRDIPTEYLINLAKYYKTSTDYILRANK